MVDQPSKTDNAFYRMSARELFVDFFGSLVPGMVFILLAMIVFLWPVLAFLSTVQQLAGGTGAEAHGEFANSAGTVLSSFWVETLLFTLMVSYVVGHLFYRQDPKTPDQQSFLHISREWSRDEKAKWVAKELSDCEFPYQNLREYLRTRGLRHLVPMVPWPGINSVNRTKNFINILKIRLGWHHAEKCGAISRNEAHVRLMSSTWYVSRALCLVSLVGLVVGVAACVLALWLGTAEERMAPATLNLIPPAMSVLGFVGAWKARCIIESFLHYQRVREIVFVLETAYTAFRHSFEEIRDVCSDLSPTSDGEEEGG